MINHRWRTTGVIEAQLRTKLTSDNLIGLDETSQDSYQTLPYPVSLLI